MPFKNIVLLSLFYLVVLPYCFPVITLAIYTAISCPRLSRYLAICRSSTSGGESLGAVLSTKGNAWKPQGMKLTVSVSLLLTGLCVFVSSEG